VRSKINKYFSKRLKLKTSSYPFTYKPTVRLAYLLIMNTLIEKLNSLEIIQKYDWIESIPSDIYNEYFD